MSPHNAEVRSKPRTQGGLPVVPASNNSAAHYNQPLPNVLDTGLGPCLSSVALSHIILRSPLSSVLQNVDTLSIPCENFPFGHNTVAGGFPSSVAHIHFVSELHEATPEVESLLSYLPHELTLFSSRTLSVS